jgi:uncharacterized protein YchJ
MQSTPTYLVVVLSEPMITIARTEPTRGEIRKAGRNRLRYAGPVVPHQRRAGRNDPCDCGSGKRWKRCCGGPK